MAKLHLAFRWLFILYVSLIIGAVALMVSEWKFHHARLLNVQTGSMVPAFRPGDVLFVEPITGPIQLGSIVTYVSPLNGQYVSHRVVAVDSARHQLTTRGDNAVKPDTPISQSAVVGRVEFILPRLGTLITYLRRPAGLIVFVYLPALYVVVSELRRLKRNYNHQTKYHLLGYR